MTKNESQKLPHGLYRLCWESGGSSLVAVGSLHDGTRWYAPTNWTSETSKKVIGSTDWERVVRVEKIEPPEPPEDRPEDYGLDYKYDEIA